MKQIKMKELSKGDIFTLKMKLKNREAFQVLKVEEKSLKVISKNDNLGTIKRIPVRGSCLLLRSNQDL